MAENQSVQMSKLQMTA